MQYKFIRNLQNRFRFSLASPPQSNFFSYTPLCNFNHIILGPDILFIDNLNKYFFWKTLEKEKNKKLKVKKRKKRNICWFIIQFHYKLKQKNTLASCYQVKLITANGNLKKYTKEMHLIKMTAKMIIPNAVLILIQFCKMGKFWKWKEVLDTCCNWAKHYNTRRFNQWKYGSVFLFCC